MDMYEDLASGFLDETRQHLETIEPDLLELETQLDRTSPEIVHRLFRGIHSIKGASGFLGLQNIGRLTHQMENILSLVRNGKLAPSPELVDRLLSGVDLLKTMLDDLEHSDEMDIQKHINILETLTTSTSQAHQLVELTLPSMDPNNEPEVIILNKEDIQRYINSGMNLYCIKINLHQDLRVKNKTPMDFITNMNSLGEYVDAFIDTSHVTGLSDCLDQPIVFQFLFATVLDPDMVPMGLEVPPDQVIPIDLTPYQQHQNHHYRSALSEVTKEDKNQTFTSPPSSASGSTVKPDSSTETQQPAKITSKRYSEDEKIRVRVDFLDNLVNLAGELVLGRNQLIQMAYHLTDENPELKPILHHISRITTEMQEHIMQMRMQPVSQLFNRLKRVVRDLSRSQNKSVELVISGEEVELDKTIIEGLSDPLIHLIRNAIDHGIEPGDVRERSQKPSQGKVEVRAYHQGGQVHIQVCDDGCGIDADHLGKVAVDQGLITRDQLAKMSSWQRLQLIFSPGFSTSATITDLSGRGVGMDVVKTNIESLGGSIDIQTESGQGTCFSLILPLTLAIETGLLVKTAGQIFIVPESDIDELVRIKPSDIANRLIQIQDAWMVKLRNQLIPLINLNLLFGHQQSESELFQRKSDAPLRILILKHSGVRFGVYVDDTLNIEEIVVKPLPTYFRHMKWFSGVTILGNGNVALILDTAGLFSRIRLQQFSQKQIPSDQPFEDGKKQAEVQSMLVFENNTPERFAIPLPLIRRIEQIPVSHIEQIQDMKYIQYEGKKIKLVFLEDHLPVTRPPGLPNDIIGVLMPKTSPYPAGIVVHNLINTFETVIDLDTETIQGPGLFGSTIIDGKITLLPDMFSLFEMDAPQWQQSASYRCDPHFKPKILVVDDTPFFRQVEQSYLESAGYDVQTAENGKEALEILKTNDIDLVLLDITMPGMDGWETIRAIRQNHRWQNLPVMAVTSLDDKDLIRKGRAVGFNDWESKLNKMRLLEKVKHLLPSETKPNAGKMNP